MRKLIAAATAVLVSVGVFAACNNEKTWQDGTYTAAFADYDSRGYKDTLELTIEDGVIQSVRFEGENAEGGQKTADETLRRDMEAVQNNYPAQVYPTLSNQLLVVQSIGDVDVVAGATYSTECFKALFNALEGQMYEGDTTPLVVDNIPER